MAAGGLVSAAESEQGTKESAAGASPFRRVPVQNPPFSLSQIKRSIPPHCFRRNIALSFYYLAVDLGLIVLFLYIALFYIPNLPSFLYLAAWPLYWVAQGAVMTGVFLIIHDCGHNAFSNYPLLDDLVGFILHSALLVPYFSWKYSHRRHHSNTGCLERDEAYVPKLRDGVPWYSRCLNSPPGRILFIAGMLTLAWPLYIAFNTWGRPYDRFASHFDPNSPIYNDRERVQVLVSDSGVLAVSYGLYRLAAALGFWWLVRVYGAPLLITNAFIIIGSYLQHTHPALPRYRSSEWDWLRGALSTVDRDFGILNKVFHNGTITHVLHHIFPTIPHYHALEASRAIKPLLGDYYRLDTTPVAKALWREVKECLYVEPDDGDNAENSGILWYRNKY